MLNLKPCKYKKILFIVSILMISSLNMLLMNLGINQISEFNNENDINNFQIKDLKTQDLDSDNIYSGFGAPWNITHWANRTVYNKEVSFTNDSYNIIEVPLGSGWEGYKLNATIKDLTDARNWCNGSFSYGEDNDYQDIGNDTADISNEFQNWTFGKFDLDDDSDMAGNYLDTTSNNPETDDHDCLELKITGFPIPPPPPPTDTYGYDGQDRCYWTSLLQIPRGEVLDSEIKFDIRDLHLMESNNFELRISLNDQQIYSIGALSLRQACGDSWRTFSIPQILWWNSSNIYSNPINNSYIKVNFTLIVAQPAGYYYSYEGFDNNDYQQLLIDNVELKIKATVKPSQIQLKMNNQTVDDINWGKGTVEQNNTWTTNPVQLNFTSEDIGKLGGYNIDLKTNLNLYTRKYAPETNYETNTNSLGTSFSVSNNSIVNWEFYAYFSVPTGYEENEMRLNFPLDVNITWVSEPQDPSTNRLEDCINSTQGLLIVAVDNISSSPDGFWKFKAVSPNYCEQINIFRNAADSWIIDNEFLSGDYINITARISDSSLISGYIEQTKVQLHLKFPNGTIWTAQNQLKSPDAIGNVYFDAFQIPNSPPNYEVGEYEAIITWNNSYSTFGLNETGVIYKKFIIIHESILTPDQNYYEEIFEDEVINLKVSFNDLENFDAIQDAQLYLDNFLDSRQFFSEISPGYYFLEFNTTGGIAGINTLTIYANSSLYTNTQVNVSVELVLELIVQPIGFKDTIDAEIGETINIQLQLLDPNTNNSIENASITYSWKYGVDSINQTSPGMYQANVNLPDNVKGNYKFDLTIIPENSTYRTTQYSFIVVIGEPIVDEPESPNYLLWIIIGVLVSIVSALGVLSLRTYVYMPRRRKKEAELLSKTQRFKDLNNIQAIVIVHKFSGIPIYSRSYSILERHKKELFSGFIQAITMIGEEFVEKGAEQPESDDKEKGFGVEKMIELDFKQFYCLIADIEDLRAVFILKERSSERLKSQVSHLILALNLKLSEELENWDGSLDKFEILVPEILNEYFELYYKDSFRLADDVNLIRMKKEKSLSKMEMRVVNVIQSMSNDNVIANLNSIIELVHEDNKNLIIEAIESLIKQKIIIPLNN